MKITLNISAPEHSVFGRVLNHLLYRNDDLLELVDVVDGCPHSGGMHNLTVSGDSVTIHTWLDLLVETYPQCWYTVQHIRKEVRKARTTEDCIKRNSVMFNLQRSKGTIWDVSNGRHSCHWFDCKEEDHAFIISENGKAWMELLKSAAWMSV